MPLKRDVLDTSFSSPFLISNFEVRVEITPDTMAKELILREYFQPSIDVHYAIVLPEIEAESYEINPGIIQLLVKNYQFDGSVDKNPYHHLSNFLALCQTFKLRDVSDDAVRLRLFPFSLRDEAEDWLFSLPDNSITTWKELAQVFLNRYVRPFESAKRKNITNSSRERVSTADAIMSLSDEVANLSRMIEKMSLLSNVKQGNERCEICGGPHESRDCQEGNFAQNNYDSQIGNHLTTSGFNQYQNQQRFQPSSFSHHKPQYEHPSYY